MSSAIKKEVSTFLQKPLKNKHKNRENVHFSGIREGKFKM
jgi:hypothetical protein